MPNVKPIKFLTAEVGIKKKNKRSNFKGYRLGEFLKKTVIVVEFNQWVFSLE